MEKQEIVLVHRSQGERGEWGLQKKYIILIEGRKVTLSWGKAEFWSGGFQHKTHYFTTEFEAEQFAIATMYKKMDKGYVELETTRV